MPKYSKKGAGECKTLGWTSPRQMLQKWKLSKRSYLFSRVGMASSGGTKDMHINNFVLFFLFALLQAPHLGHKQVYSITDHYRLETFLTHVL